MNPPISLDLFVAATMRRSRHVLQLVKSQGVDEMSLLEAEALAGANGLFDLTQLRPELVRQCFGDPEREEPGCLTYSLDYWPDHMFEWRYGSSGIAYAAGFVLTSPWSTYEPVRGLNEGLAQLRPWYHTGKEIVDLIGIPVAERDWGSLGEWYYGPTPDGRDLVLFLDYGLLTDTWLQAGMIGALQG